MQKTRVSPSPFLITRRTLFYSDVLSSQATSWQTSMDGRLPPPVAAPLLDPHLSTGGTRDWSCDPLDPLLQLCPFGQSPRRSRGGQLPIWQVLRASGPRHAPHCQYPHARWQAFPEGMQNGSLFSQRNVGLRRGFKGSDLQGYGNMTILVKNRLCAWKRFT